MKTILVVDDDPLARRMIGACFGREEALRLLDARVLEASDGKKALMLAEAEPPDLVIVDLLMPRMDGFAFCRSFRAPRAAARSRCWSSRGSIAIPR